MQAIYRYQLEQLHFPVDGYLYTVSTITSVDEGETFYYGGNTRYFKTQKEAAAYKERQEAQERCR